MTQLDTWLGWLEGEVGIAEMPPGSNRTPIGEEFGWNGVAWCCITQSVATLHAFGDYVLHTAGVADAMSLAQRGVNGMQWLSRGDREIRQGDLPCYDFGPIHGRHGKPDDYHIEGVINPGTQDKFQTIGGNVGNAVREQWRDRTYVTGFIRLPFTGGDTPPNPEEDDPLADYGEVLMKMQASINDLATVVSNISTELGRMAPIVRGDGSQGADMRTVLENDLGEVRRNLRAADVALGITPETSPTNKVDLSKVTTVADQVKKAVGK